MKSNRKKRRQVKMYDRKINGRMSKKLVGLFVAVIVALVGLSIRIIYINAARSKQNKKNSMNRIYQQYKNQVIPFQRGNILDRNKNILATSEKIYNVILDCKVMNDINKRKEYKNIQKYLESTIKILVKELGLEEKEIQSMLEDENTRDSQYQILKSNLSMAEKKKLEKCLDEISDKEFSDEEKLEFNNIKVIWLEENYLRVYPMNSLACNLIGFSYSDNSANWGIEGYYSSVLNGVNGRQYAYINQDEKINNVIISPVNGKNVISTIDVNVQKIIRRALEIYQMEMNAGPNGTGCAKKVGILVMNPNNGEILGMDSSDWYDLNYPRDLRPFYTDEEINSMDDKTMLEKLNNIWRNYCISDAFEPGSTVKPMTVAAALDMGLINTEESFYCDGYEMIENQRIRCSIFPNEHGKQTLEDALVHSCNDVIMQIAAKMGSKNFLRYQNIFNFGFKTGIDLPGENSGILHTADNMGEIELATASFGQGFTCTMIQEAAAFSSVINGGYYYKPHVVSEITNSQGDVVQVLGSGVERQTISSAVSDAIRKDLEGVLKKGGTAMSAKVNGYSMGGKTGTAQKIPRNSTKYLVSYIGFAPLDDPQIVVYVVVDEPNVENQCNSLYAQKIAKNVFTELLPYMNIFPDEVTVE